MNRFSSMNIDEICGFRLWKFFTFIMKIYSLFVCWTTGGVIDKWSGLHLGMSHSFRWYASTCEWCARPDKKSNQRDSLALSLSLSWWEHTRTDEVCFHFLLRKRSAPSFWQRLKWNENNNNKWNGKQKLFRAIYFSYVLHQFEQWISAEAPRPILHCDERRSRCYVEDEILPRAWARKLCVRVSIVIVTVKNNSQ